jgi:hypothetical protein
MLFRPHERPWPILASELARNLVFPVMIGDAFCDIVCLPDIETSAGILQNIDPAHVIGSSGRIRTYDQSVNSRPLYH